MEPVRTARSYVTVSNFGHTSMREDLRNHSNFISFSQALVNGDKIRYHYDFFSDNPSC